MPMIFLGRAEGFSSIDFVLMKMLLMNYREFIICKNHFLPKLTEEEMELVERRDRYYFQTFHQSENPDVMRREMLLSESDSKYVRGLCQRNTYIIDNPTFQVPNAGDRIEKKEVSANHLAKKFKKHKCCNLQ